MDDASCDTLFCFPSLPVVGLSLFRGCRSAVRPSVCPSVSKDFFSLALCFLFLRMSQMSDPIQRLGWLSIGEESEAKRNILTAGWPAVR